MSITISFVTEASLQSRSLPAHAKRAVLTEWWKFLSETSAGRNQQLPYSNPCLSCLFLLAFHSLSFISLTLKTFVHTRNCMHSSYTLSKVTCFQQDRLLLYFSFLSYWKLFLYVNFFFVVVAFPPPAGGTVKHGVLSSFGTRSNSVDCYLITLASWQCSILDNLYFSVGSSYMWVLAHIAPPAHNLPWLARFCLVPVNSPASFRGRDGRWWRRKSSSLLDQQVSVGNAY